MAIKAVLAHAFEKKVTKLCIWNVHHNGPSFWPSMGAVCFDRPVPNVGCHIEQNIWPQGDSLSPKVALGLYDIVQLGRHNDLAAWRALAQSHFKFKDGTSVKEKIFKGLCYAENMLLDLENPLTRSILKEHIGAFSVSSPQSNLATKPKPPLYSPLQIAAPAL